VVADKVRHCLAWFVSKYNPRPEEPHCIPQHPSLCLLRRPRAQISFIALQQIAFNLFQQLRRAEEAQQAER
jgi:hypothetical protein